MNAYRRTATTALALLALAVLTLIPAAGAQADDLWLHVHVDEKEGGATVRVNLPLAFVETALRAVPADELRNGRLVIDDEDFTVAELRDMWTSLSASGDATLVEVDDDGERVHVRRAGGYLLVEVDEGKGDGATVDVRIPERVIEAMLATGSDELDLAAGLRALAESGEGELVAVNDGGDHVRVWIDSSSASR